MRQPSTMQLPLHLWLPRAVVWVGVLAVALLTAVWIATPTWEKPPPDMIDQVKGREVGTLVAGPNGEEYAWDGEALIPQNPPPPAGALLGYIGGIWAIARVTQFLLMTRGAQAVLIWIGGTGQVIERE